MNKITTADELNQFLPYSVELDSATPQAKVDIGTSGDEEIDWVRQKHSFTYRIIYEKILDVVDKGMVLGELPEVKNGNRVFVLQEKVVNSESGSVARCPFTSIYSSVYLLQLYQRELSGRVLEDVEEKYVEAVNRKVNTVENDIESKLSGVSVSIKLDEEPIKYAELV